jgi:hypothetical protein
VQFASPETSVEGTAEAKAFCCMSVEETLASYEVAYSTNDLMNMWRGILIRVDEAG